MQAYFLELVQELIIKHRSTDGTCVSLLRTCIKVVLEHIPCTQALNNFEINFCSRYLPHVLCVCIQGLHFLLFVVFQTSRLSCLPHFQVFNKNSVVEVVMNLGSSCCDGCNGSSSREKRKEQTLEMEGVTHYFMKDVFQRLLTTYVGHGIQDIEVG